MMKHAAMVIRAARPSVNSAPRSKNATTSGAVAAMTITFDSLTILLRQIAQTAATTQTARSASANSTTLYCHAETAVVTAKARVNAGPTRLATRTSRRTRSSASTSTLGRAFSHETRRKRHTAMSAAGRRIPLRRDPVGAVVPKYASAPTMTTP